MRRPSSWSHAGLVDGLRIDHPDGLANPREYLDRLGERGVERIWVEKILEPGERLRADWPVEGTTGYEFANDVDRALRRPGGEEPMTELYTELTGERRPFAEIASEAKLEVARTTFAQEFERLRALHPHAGLEEAAAAMHVYRTYVEPETNRVREEDRRAVDTLPEDLRATLLLEGERTPARDEFVVRWQQTTGAVMAKGVEDTAFYRWFRLTALNEVGGNPDRFSLSRRGVPPRGARAPRTASRARCSPPRPTTRSAPATSARASARSPAMHDEWAERVRRWHALTGGMDDPNEEYLVWQTLVGAWPIVPGRVELYLEKALREAKRTTNWLEPNEAHERRVREFVRSLYSNQEFLDDFEPFVARVARAGEHASLGALLLRLTSPGVPDLYQGDALWSLNLVDPDNRRPVNWPAHASVLRERGADSPHDEDPPHPAGAASASGAARRLRRRLRAASTPARTASRTCAAERSASSCRSVPGDRADGGRPRSPPGVRPGAERRRLSVSNPRSPAPSPQGIREDAGPGWSRADQSGPGREGFDARSIEPRPDEKA